MDCSPSNDCFAARNVIVRGAVGYASFGTWQIRRSSACFCGKGGPMHVKNHLNVELLVRWS